jgi:TRAP-type C4-dicarboxylate transport system substrate-binding protein
MMLRRTGSFAIACVAVLMCVLAAPPVSAEKISLKIASGHNASWHFIQITQNYFIPELKKRVKERTAHEIDFTEGFAGAMVKPTEVLEGLQSGIIDIGVFCYCHEGQKLALHNFPMYLPFGPTDPAISLRATRKVYDSIPEFHQILEKNFGQKQLAMVPFESYNIISRVPMNGPADAKGRKISGAGPNLFWVEKVGALPLTITGPEVYTGFQSGLMDGNVVFVSILDTLKLYDVAPYMIKIGFGSMTITPIHINLRRFQRLPKEVQDILVEVGRDTEAFAANYTQEMIDKYDGIITKNGAKIINVDEAGRKAWADALKDTPGEIAVKFDRESKIPMGAAMKAYIAATEAEGYVWPVRYKID